MNILVTGAKGMMGTALVNRLKTIQDGRDRTRPNLKIDEIYEYDRSNTPEELDGYCASASFVFNLAGINRPKDPAEFKAGNFGFASTLLDMLKKHNNKAPVMLSSSLQATLAGRFGTSEYGLSKKAGEDLFFEYASSTGSPVFVYRFPNVMGHSKPNYNSAVSTFANAIARDLPYTVNDPSTVVELVWFGDIVEGMLDLLEGKVCRCEYPKVDEVVDGVTYDGLTPHPTAAGKFCYIPVTHKVTLGEIISLLQSFKEQRTTLNMPKMPTGSFAKKLFSLYLEYLKPEDFKYALKMNVDNRGSFTELVHYPDAGQVSVNVSKAGITKGEHFHLNGKWEQFIVVKGHGLIQERNINTGEMVEFEVSGDKIESVFMIPSWTHNLVNLSDTEDLVTIMTCNETFDKDHPDTYALKVVE